MRRFLLAALAAVLAAAPAMASEKKKAAPNPTVLMSPVALPVVVDRKLVNYVYVTLRLQLSAKADAGALREKEPFFRDALVRTAHRTHMARTDDLNALDHAKLKAVVLSEGARIAGPGMVTGIQVIKEQPQKLLPRPQKPKPAA